MIILFRYLISPFSVSAFAASTEAKNTDSKFYIKKGNYYPLCQEIKQILDEIANANYANPFIDMDRSEDIFKILKKYKN